MRVQGEDKLDQKGFSIRLPEDQIEKIDEMVIFGLIFLISFSRELLGPGFTISWAGEGLILAITVALLLAVSAMTRFLDKERIIKSIS